MMFECVAIWEGMLYGHTAPTIEDAKEWAKCYTQQKNCAVRVWKVKI